VSPGWINGSLSALLPSSGACEETALDLPSGMAASPMSGDDVFDLHENNDRARAQDKINKNVFIYNNSM
jgi:hypothetical protein